jgi:alkylation response protein AidB-like acyl-CoA dehydrogenase
MSSDALATPDDSGIDEIVEEVHRFAADRIDPVQIDRAHRIPRELLAELADLGVFGLSIPEAFGGMGLPLGPICEVVTALAEHDRSVATTVGLHLGLGTRGLIAFGDPATQARVLPRLATGEHLAAFAATEAGAGSDLRSVRTRATPAEGGGLRVDGEKIFVTNGGLAQVYTLLVSTPGMAGRRKGYSLLWLDRDDPGLTVGAEEDKLGLRGSSTTSLFIDGVRVGEDRIFGRAGYGIEEIGHVLAWGRTAMAAGCVGASRSALRKTVAHVHERRQFGKSLAAQPVVQEQLADLAALHFAMAAMVGDTAASETPEVLERRSLATKILCSDGNWQICDRAVQLFGGSGYIEETGIPMLLRDSRITRIFEGANDVLVGLIGALEATSPSTPWATSGPGSEDAAALCEQMDARRRHLAQTLKLRLLRRPRLLAQLGRLGILRQSLETVVDAASRSPNPVAADLAEHWVQLCWRRAAPDLADPPHRDRIDRIAEQYAQETRP